MPLTKKGKKIMSNMISQYGTKRGKEVFYASKNAGKIKGVDKGFYGHYDVMKMGNTVIIVGMGMNPHFGDMK